ncbi:hypothetical protein GCM10011360_33810 [Primorskyibacter flagellatus]|uniref:Uncharacterized protein n=1 Tax=Primorskyibacter flagellatus TaxID=1387277 RepID=A0A917AE55_9RHOB|nr:hypothetical protein [Primorskyibacter flagellatus]GGE43782.1 hypothetical protein GCM10011360_33810 [Primorskyibacter flagellatus]
MPPASHRTPNTPPKRPWQARHILRTILCLIATTAIAATPEFDPEGPFRQGEGFGTPATCATLPGWIDRVPDYDGRISMTVTGRIVQSHWDGTLAYAIMCAPDEVQVMCVTYAPADVDGKEVMFAGGFLRAGERRIMLDPCLIYPAD